MNITIIIRIYILNFSVTANIWSRVSNYDFFCLFVLFCLRDSRGLTVFKNISLVFVKVWEGKDIKASVGAGLGSC